MEENPYSMMMALIRQTAAETVGGGLCLGKVTSAEPLRVLAEGNTLERDELLAAEGLTAGAAARVRAELTGELAVDASCPAGNHSSARVTGGVLSGTLAREAEPFRAGDQLLLLPIEEEVYFW